ncbi:hypothetical protein [Corallococcus carmarthensis]|uniref:hypothetical protein n=1 Tax=Corallococcus carmarthensis TaxID=2316728 RepID=UPI00148BBBB5|nr:hypothetical protein [Corallococcus carmarthensis]NOK21689.1 hypothetical protein [Corallococcus carmarthensis]
MSAPSTSPRRTYGVLGGIGACALVAVGLVRYAMDFEDVLFVNGLDIPVTITAGSSRFTLEANDHLTRRMSTGAMDVEVVGEGGTLARDTVVVTDERGLFLYNVLGAAPLYTSVIYYTRSSARNDTADSEPQPLAGLPFQRVRPIDFMLTNPPSTMSMRKEDGQTMTRVHLGQAPGGWGTSFNWLLQTQHYAEANRLAEGLLRALPKTPGVDQAAFVSRIALARTEGRLPSIAAAREWRDAYPDDLDAHRMWAHEMMRAGRGAEVRAWYADAVAREPGSMGMTSMLARVEPAEEAIPRLEALVQAHPGESLPQKALCMRYVRQLRWADALPLLEAMAKGDAEYATYRDTHATVLAGLGRREEAARAFGKQLLEVDEAERLDSDDLLLYARLSGGSWRHGGDVVMTKLLARASKDLPEGVLQEWVAAVLGEPVDAEALRKVPAENPYAGAARVLMALAEEPEFAARAVAGADFRVMRYVGTEAGVLLAAEFERQGDSALAARTLDLTGVSLSFEDLQDVVQGRQPVNAFGVLEWGERAALQLVLARKMDAEGKDSKAAYALVKKAALLPGPVTVALKSWDRPTPSNAVAGDSVP